MRKEISSTELDFLLRFPAAVNVSSPVDFLSNHSWGGIKVCGHFLQYPNPLPEPTSPEPPFAFDSFFSPGH